MKDEKNIQDTFVNDYSYSVNSKNNTITIEKYKGNDVVVKIPNNIDGKKVTSIGKDAFSDCISLAFITIPNSITTIDKDAFSQCLSLQYNEYDNAYYLGNENNPYVVLIKAKSTDITSCAINKKCKVICDSAFSGCTCLTSIIIPDGVTSIGDVAFFCCDNLTSIRIPYRVTSIGFCAFASSGLTKVTLGNSVTSIGESAFLCCSNLTSIRIPDSVTTIGNAAFLSCTSLQYNEYDNGYYLGNDNNPYVILIEVKSKDITSCKINKNCKVICEGAFSGCTNLINITIPDSVIKIGDSAFKDCMSLTSITIPNSVTSIGDVAFEGCTCLTSIIIPDSVTSIGDIAFSGCTSLTSITIPDSVTTIGNNAFKNCSNLTTVYYTGTYDQWSKIRIGSNNDYLTYKTIYFYSKSKPTNNYWHYVDGEPTAW